jgi:hypothetical protein
MINKIFNKLSKEVEVFKIEYNEKKYRLTIPLWLWISLVLLLIYTMMKYGNS